MIPPKTRKRQGRAAHLDIEVGGVAGHADETVSRIIGAGESHRDQVASWFDVRRRYCIVAVGLISLRFTDSVAVEVGGIGLQHFAEMKMQRSARQRVLDVDYLAKPHRAVKIPHRFARPWLRFDRARS